MGSIDSLWFVAHSYPMLASKLPVITASEGRMQVGENTKLLNPDLTFLVLFIQTHTRNECSQILCFGLPIFKANKFFVVQNMK